MPQAKARARFVRGSARKMRQVVDLVRGKPVPAALNLLSVLPKSAAATVRKTVKSAAANALAAEGTAQLKAEDLTIARITVDGGPSMKRIRPMGMGRAYRINKRLCHLTVVLESVQTSEPAVSKAQGKAARRTPSSTSPKRPTVRAARASRASKTKKEKE